MAAYPSWANDTTNVRLSFGQQRINDSSVLIIIKATVYDAKLYGLQESDQEALYSTITFDSLSTKYLAGNIVEKGNVHSENDMVLDANVRFFTDSVEWQQTILIDSNDRITQRVCKLYV